MRTLYLRNVPDDVAERLERLAARSGTSMSAYAVRALTEVARRADNPALLADLPHVGLTADQVVGAVEEGRAERVGGEAEEMGRGVEPAPHRRRTR